MDLTPARSRKMSRWAKKFVWWKTPRETLSRPMDLVARIMALGTWEDVQELMAMVGRRIMKKALKDAAPGIFDPPGWHYWHRRLGLRLSPFQNANCEILHASDRHTSKAAKSLLAAASRNSWGIRPLWRNRACVTTRASHICRF